jgi:hypothetical protein
MTNRVTYTSTVGHPADNIRKIRARQNGVHFRWEVRNSEVQQNESLEDKITAIRGEDI